MGPKRKKSKPNDKAPASDEPNEPNKDSHRTIATEGGHKASAASIGVPRSSTPTREQSGNNTNNDREGTGSTKSWYVGSWKTKSPALTEIAKDGFVAASRSSSSPTQEMSKEREGTESPAMKYMEKRLATPRKSEPKGVPTSRLYGEGNPGKSEEGQNELQTSETGISEPEAPLPPDPLKPKSMGEDDRKAAIEGSKADKARPVSGWFGWWSRPDGYGSDTEKVVDASKSSDVVVVQAQKTPLPSSPNEERQKSAQKGEPNALQNMNGMASPKTTGPESEVSSDGNAPSEGRSWFGLWSKAENQKAGPPLKDQGKVEEPSSTAPIGDQHSSQANESETQGKDAESTTMLVKPVPQSSAWAFWSKDKPKDGTRATSEGTQKQVGEIAVADTPSQSSPEAAQYNEQKTSSEKASALNPTDRKRKKQMSSLGSSKSTPGASPALQPSKPSKSTDQLSELVSNETDDRGPAPSKSASAKLERISQKRARDEKTHAPPNLLLPSLRNTYSIYQSPSYWDQLRRLVFTGSPRDLNPPHHVDLLSPKEVPKIRRALAIGVHGFFPAQFVQKILGQPTGTSIRFANAAAAAIKRWAEEHQARSNSLLSGSRTDDSAKSSRSQAPEIEVEKVALEGEGMVADRVDTLWKLLLNWLPSIREADFIVVAAHSQGVPVAIQLLAKLLQFGCMREGARVGVCAMAGINMGPFAELKSRFMGASAVELFEFGVEHSQARKNYEAALEHCLDRGVRISFIGSLDDQLVSLESATFTPISHPLIHRAVFINSALHASDFLPHLVGFALKLRNLGISDHGLTRELSGPLAGSLYTGDGHSKLYDDSQVLLRAVEFALETTDTEHIAKIGQMKLELASTTGRPGSSGGLEAAKDSAGTNPYYLPWALRGVLEEPYVKEHLQGEVTELVEMFEKWRPVSKVLKDVRFRLEAVRSKL